MMDIKLKTIAVVAMYAVYMALGIEGVLALGKYLGGQ